MDNLPITPEQFLSAFFDAGDIVCPRVFSDRRDSTFRGQKYQCDMGRFGELVETLHKHNEQNRGIFFTINSGGHEDAEINRINAQFVEMDDATFEEQWERVNAFPVQPSMIVKTRKSLHCYWLMKNADVNKFRNVQKRLVTQFDGDPHCVNESRVMRIPGFNHCKAEPVMVECVKFAPELRYTQSELEAVLPTIPDESPTANSVVPKGSRKGLTLFTKRCDFIKHCESNAASLPEGLWYAMITNLAVFDGGDKVIHMLSKPYPKYNYSETENKIKHFLESGTKPMTCAKLAELGFRCPKLESGECGCKSPAALAYKPLAPQELLIILNNFDIPAAAINKIQKIKTFITDYLYNIEPVIAETLLSHDVRERFGLKVSDIKPLFSFHRETWKKYSSSKDTKRETDGAELPDWYEATDKGGLRFLPGVLADHMAKNVNAFYGAGSYFFYGDGVYNAAEELEAQAAVRGFMIPRSATMSAITDATGQWKMLIRKPVREINANPFIVNLKNGLYNVLDGSFKPHSPEYFSTVQISANYDPAAQCPQFLEFLSDILPETELPLIQEMLGYLLIPVNKAQKSFVLVGAANAGKSTLLSIIQEVLLGSENVSNIPWQSLSDRFNKAELFGKLANIFADLPSKSIDDGGMFKALTGEDYINAERKNRDPFSFRPYARLLFSCNEIPKNYADRSDGFYRRLIIIRFDKSVPQERRDPNLRDRIAVECDGILNWALIGLRRLLAYNYQFTETDRTRNEVTRYKIESNSALTFVDEYCNFGDELWIPREEFYQRYKDFCQTNGMKAQSQATFNKELESNFANLHRGQDKVSGRKVWRGIAYIDGGKE